MCYLKYELIFRYHFNISFFQGRASAKNKNNNNNYGTFDLFNPQLFGVGWADQFAFPLSIAITFYQYKVDLMTFPRNVLSQKMDALYCQLQPCLIRSKIPDILNFLVILQNVINL